MPLTSFQGTPRPMVPGHDLTFGLGTPDISEAAPVADQAMFELGLAGADRDRNLEEITADFTELVKTGYDGRLHVLPKAAVTFGHILATAEGKRSESVPTAWIYANLWTPGTEANSYTESELNAGPSSHVARLAVFSSLETGYDPLLHDLDKPYDSYKDKNIDVNPKGLPTQLEELKADEAALAARHAGHTLSALDHRAFAVLALMDRIRGTKTESQVLSRGVGRIPALGRRLVGGNSMVGDVDSGGGQLYLSGSSGDACPDVGVGRSMGLEEL